MGKLREFIKEQLMLSMKDFDNIDTSNLEKSEKEWLISWREHESVLKDNYNEDMISYIRLGHYMGWTNYKINVLNALKKLHKNNVKGK